MYIIDRVLPLMANIALKRLEIITLIRIDLKSK